MGKFELILNAQLTIIVYMAFGWCIKRLQYVSDTTIKDFMHIVQQITLPCLIIYSLAKEISWQELIQARWIVFVSGGIMVGSFLLGLVLFQGVKDQPQRAVLQFGTLSSNCGSAGLSLLQSIMGDTGLLYANLYAIPSRIASWTVGVTFFLNLPIQQRIKKALLNPALIAIIMGIFLQFWHIPLPNGVWAGISTVGNCTNPISMIAIGMILAQAPKEKLFDRNILKLAAARLLMIPLLVLIVLRTISMDSITTTSAVLLSGNPSAMVTVVIAEQYGGDYTLASKCVFLTSVCSIITIIILFMAM